nr:immunoglobulin heavy chain junction region [Macaca mulatta]MOX37860.1 immunoglobulin heavy chain junction region [Macaca mulatta]MOX38337.1 immunoglobulin heavy chain junction region [Macaca mulatta]MOX38759.1 immunoglobulin heavy chain junction region [Macaca mulatta]MOX38941.1 immunoglobulin heavy chain junction region [Macaca mulatta]
CVRGLGLGVGYFEFW